MNFTRLAASYIKYDEDLGLIFQDWKYIPSGFIGESWLFDNIFEIIEAIDDMDDTKKEAFELALPRKLRPKFKGYKRLGFLFRG